MLIILTRHFSSSKVFVHVYRKSLKICQIQTLWSLAYSSLHKSTRSISSYMDNKQKTQKTNVLITSPTEEGMEGTVATQDTQKTRRKKYLSKKLSLLILVFFLLSGVASSISVLAYQKYTPIYHSDLSLAQTGIQHLHNAATLLENLSKKPLDPAAVIQSQHEFAAAAAAFSQVKASLTSLPGVLTVLPVYGS